MHLRLLLLAGLGAAVCEEAPAHPSAPPVPPAPGTVARGTPGVPASARAAYPWRPTSTVALDARFPAPAGFARVDAADGSFAAFVRTLPLLPEGSKVVDHAGAPLYDDGHHRNIAAVVDLDVGGANLQQCADVVIRVHAEWRYGTGARDIAYRSLSGTTIAYRRYLAGERAVARGNAIAFVPGVSRRDDHAFFRSYLDDVFAWANTTSLERDAAKVSLPDLRPGDFFVMSGSPIGHAVLVLDAARDSGGRIALLLGQGYMPAQSFHVLRLSESQAWFVVEPGAASVKTPFWPAFPFSALRRL